MLKRFKNLLVTVLAFGLMTTPVMVPALVSADTPDISGNLCGGSSLSTSTSTNCTSGQATTAVQNILGTVINIFSLIVGIVAVIMIIVGGLKYITSGGDSCNISSAKNTIIFAIVGLVIVALAQVLVHFVLAKTTAAIPAGS